MDISSQLRLSSLVGLLLLVGCVEKPLTRDDVYKKYSIALLMDSRADEIDCKNVPEQIKAASKNKGKLITCGKYNLPIADTVKSINAVYSEQRDEDWTEFKDGVTSDYVMSERNKMTVVLYYSEKYELIYAK